MFELKCDIQFSVSIAEIHLLDECNKNGSSDAKYYHSPQPSGHVGTRHHNLLQIWKRIKGEARFPGHTAEKGRKQSADHRAIHIALFNKHPPLTRNRLRAMGLCPLAGEYQSSPSRLLSLEVGFASDCSKSLAFFLMPMCLGKFRKIKTFNFYCPFLITK